MVSSPRFRTISRTRSARGVPPGSRVTRAVNPRAVSHSLTSRATVDLPAPSMPSRVMKRPLLGDVAMGSRLSLSLLRLVLLGSQVLEIALHSGIVLFEGPGEVVAAITGGRRHEIDFTCFLRLHGREDRFAPGQCNRGGRQSCTSIRVVRRIGGEVLGPYSALIARPGAIDARGIGLRTRALAQSRDKNSCNLRTLRRQAGLFLDNGGEEESFVRCLQGQIGAALLPGFLQVP